MSLDEGIDDINDPGYAQVLYERERDIASDRRCWKCSSHPECHGVAKDVTVCPHNAEEFAFTFEDEEYGEDFRDPEAEAAEAEPYDDQDLKCEDVFEHERR